VSFVRVREHVNPLASKYQTPATPPDWSDVYANPTRPLHLDIGCGRGRFVLQMAQRCADWNFLGLEIREPLVHQANQVRRDLGLDNLHYLFCNANNSARPLLASLPGGVLQRVSIQFPDPWFKRKQHKRRVMQPQLVADIAEFLAPGGELFLQSDVLELAVDMRDRVHQHPAFVSQQSDWLSTNPMPIPTEREVGRLENGEPVYRALFIAVAMGNRTEASQEASLESAFHP
jgi:tRNA (guanine-N7-)-methyltransferase